MKLRYTSDEKVALEGLFAKWKKPIEIYQALKEHGSDKTLSSVRSYIYNHKLKRTASKKVQNCSLVRHSFEIIFQDDDTVIMKRR